MSGSSLMATRGWRARLAVLLVPALALSFSAMTMLGAAPAGADTVPVVPGTPTTVTSDYLPTVQINGVAWDQVVVGNTVYVVGQFTSARPAGAAAGTSETPRSNLLAYNITTGNLITTWAPTINAQGKTITASADGARIYVGGSFTQANATARNRIAAFNATTGALITTFNPNANSTVNDIVVSGTTAYFVGNFSAVSNQARGRMAAVDATTGALRPWAPTADREVRTLVAPAGLQKIVVGGHFETLNGLAIKGMVALDSITGAVMPWPVNQIATNWGADAAIWSLTTNGTSVFGTGYTYLVNGLDTGNFEGTFSADASTGELQWITSCRGDHYDVAVIGSVVYDVSHTHDCAGSGGNPQTEPWTQQYATAWTTAPAAGGATNAFGYFTGQPRPQFLHWLPALDPGTFTGRSQAAWTIEGNSQYVALGGEFPRVNGVAQNGLARFAVSGVAPDKDGPRGGFESLPKLVGLSPGSLRVSWLAAWDRDNERLTYEVLRGASAPSAVVVKTFTKDTTWWNRPQLSFNDTTAAPGSTQTYRIRVTDPKGNSFTSNPATGTVPTGSPGSSAYRTAVQADSPDTYWRLAESAGTPGYDQVGASDLTVESSASRNVAGALLNETDGAITFDGAGSTPAATTGTGISGPSAFSVETWFKTTTNSGGKIVGFGCNATGNSGCYDRHIYMSDDGTLRFGIYDGGTRTISSGPGFNDGQWHHAVGTMGSGGQQFFVDGKLIGTDPNGTSAQVYNGYWRVGGDNLNGWPGQPSNSRFAGSIDETAIYAAPLSLAQVRNHFLASGRPQTWPTPPTRPSDTYGGLVWDSNPSLYLRLDETSGTTALNRAEGDVGANYADGVTLGGTGSPAAPTGTSISLDSGAARVVGAQQVNNPQTFSLETWVKTTTTQGGRIIGFGRSQDESSGSYDRHLYMLDSGQLRYGVYTGNTETIDSPLAYNDGQWHHVVVTNQPGSQQMFVDGQLVVSGNAPFAENYPGYWRLGSDNIWGGASTKNFRGQLDEAAVYPSILSAQTVLDHWAAAGGGVPNVVPVSLFSASSVDLLASFNGSGSSDSDGTVVSYGWNFGDGSTGTGVSAQRTYGAAGTYTVTLTVTDDDGATGVSSQQVTVTAPVVVNYASDSFFRTLASGFGAADLGGTWTLGGTTSNFSVNGGAGRMVAGAGVSRTASLNSVAQSSTEVNVKVSFDRASTGGGIYFAVQGRRINSSNDYRVKVRVLSNNTVSAQLVRTIGGVETVIQNLATVPGLTYSVGDVLRVRLQADGVGTTQLRAKVWKDGTVEPATWLLQASDTTASLQAPGSVGLWFYLSGTSTQVPVTMSIDDFVAGPLRP